MKRTDAVINRVLINSKRGGRGGVREGGWGGWRDGGVGMRERAERQRGSEGEGERGESCGELITVKISPRPS